jgi:hypothetical protein
MEGTVFKFVFFIDWIFEGIDHEPVSFVTDKEATQ